MKLCLMNGFTGFVEITYINGMIELSAYLNGKAGEVAAIFPNPKPCQTGDKPIKATQGEYQITIDGRLIPLTDKLVISSIPLV